MSTEYTLSFLAEQFGGKDIGTCDVTEFRLLCSGILYRAHVETADWSKSDITRVLLDSGCKLRVISQPMDDYPQELALLLPVPWITETSISKKFPGASAHMMFRPDDAIARDIASLLTVLFRRLVTVLVKIRVVSPSGPEHWRDFALPLANSLALRAWKRRPLNFIHRADSLEVVDTNAPPKAIDADELEALLHGLPCIRHADAFLLSARLYAEALEIMDQRPEIAYLLLVACIEAISSAELAQWEPEDADKIKSRGHLVTEACRLGLEKQEAEQLVLKMTTNNTWSRRKFVKFLVENVDDSLWTSKDDLFVPVEGFGPSREQFEKALKAVHAARSAALHGGKRYVPSVGVGMSTRVPIAAMVEVLTGDVEVPPVTWFERVVNLALCTYLRRSVQILPPAASNGAA